ncbi:MAG: hypothetical protein IKC93_00730 [Candidatus Methanomethylophilaceae archaeon]|nr:hypothetical protein [Candidatus Methanomethylophilaceae archaeon]
MRIVMDVDLDSTLGCGQAHRWHKVDDSWEGVLGNEVITLTQTPDGFECEGTDDENLILDYFRHDDDLDSIYEECARSDEFVSGLIDRCRGLRILRQPHYECIATYILATNANVKRIGAMVEGVCRTFGRNLGGRYSFPTPEEILAKKDLIHECRLGYRADRFIEYAQSVHDGTFDPDALESTSYEECVEALLRIKGVGPKVADCIALFSYGHLEAFPIDARIGNVLRDRYGVEGSYKKLAQYARERFGRYAGYAQEFLYHADFIE